MSSSPHVGCFERCLTSCRGINLQLLNAFDLLLGLLDISYAIMLRAKLQHDVLSASVAWLAWACIIVGIDLVIVALCGFCAVHNRSCRGLVSVSSRFGIVAGSIAAPFGILCIVLQDQTFSYIEEHAEDAGLSDEDESMIKSWYWVITCGLFVTTLLQSLRHFLSSGFSDAILRMDNEYAAVQHEEDLARRERNLANEAARKEKYGDMRQKFRDKYSDHKSHGLAAAEGNGDGEDLEATL